MRKTLFNLVLSCQPPGLTTVVTPTALMTDADPENPTKALRSRLISRISEMKHNTNKQRKAAQQGFKPHRDDQVQEKSHFYVIQLIYVDLLPLSTSAASKMAWKHIPNCSHAPLVIITSIRHQCTTLLSPKVEFSRLVLQTEHRKYPISCNHQTMHSTTNSKKHYQKPPAKIPENAKISGNQPQ